MPGVGWSRFIVAAPELVVPPGQDRVLVTSHSITQALGAAVATAAGVRARPVAATFPGN